MTDNKTVTIKTVTLTEQNDQVLSPAEALEELKRQKKNGKWAFINGQSRDIMDLTEEDLIDAEDITLTYEINGG
ncbi:MAG: hypothetical protein ACP5N7_03525 [Candidatus Pacearchaeota archaeon]